MEDAAVAEEIADEGGFVCEGFDTCDEAGKSDEFSCDEISEVTSENSPLDTPLPLWRQPPSRKITAQNNINADFFMPSLLCFEDITNSL